MPSILKILNSIILCCKNTKLHSECCFEEDITNKEIKIKRCCLLDCNKSKSNSNSSTNIRITDI